MSNTLTNPTPAGRIPTFAYTWLPLLLSLAALYFPTYRDLAQNTWVQEAYAHGPLILIMALYLAWKRREVFAADFPARPSLTGWPLIVLGLALYAVGRSQDVNLLAVASQIPILAGILLITRGMAGLRALLFPVLFLAFMIPLPGFVVDSLTGSLKIQVSNVAVQTLYLLNYPVALAGVTITIGDYQLLVADACSGMHSMFSLSAVGIVYIYLMQHRSWLRNGILAAAILPIAFVANCIRVVALAMITYHYGEAAGQGLAHQLASPLLFSVAVLFLAGLDRLLGLVLPSARTEPTPSAPKDSTPAPTAAPAPIRRHAILAITLLAGVGLAFALTPTRMATENGPRVNLETLIPKQVGTWTALDTVSPLRPDPATQTLLDSLYNQILSRTYVDPQGRQVMLLIAYGGAKKNAMDLHRPEVCYPSQGFRLVQDRQGSLNTGQGQIPVQRMVAVLGTRVEPITYWMTIGDKLAQGGTGLWKLEQIKYGLTGSIPDGLLFRLSSINPDDTGAYQAQQDFTQALYQALPEHDRARFFGRPGL